MPAETDVLIVGGGPAGLAASIALRQRGLRCTVVETRSPGIDKACGEGLMPETLEALAGLGVDLRPDLLADPQQQGFPFRGIRFANALNSVEAVFPRGAGLGLRRPILHKRLADQALSAGVSLHWNSRVQLAPRQDAEAPSATLNGDPIRFRWLIGADGHSSSVRRWAGLDAMKKDRLRFGFRRHYRIAPWSDFVEIHWGPAGQLYITPVAPDCVCVVYITRKPHSAGADQPDMLDAFPELHRRLAHAPILSQQRGAVSATRKLRRVHDEYVALIGDASGSADSITGEGLAMSFRQANALAESLANGSLAGYGPAHARIGRLPLAMGSLMLRMDRWPALETRALRALSANPRLFREMLSVHVGARSPANFALRRGPQLGWNLLSPRRQSVPFTPVGNL